VIRAVTERDHDLVYDFRNPVSVNIQTVHPRKLAAVRRGCRAGRGWLGWGHGLDKVWQFIAAAQACGLLATTFFYNTPDRHRGRTELCDVGSRSRAIEMWAR